VLSAVKASGVKLPVRILLLTILFLATFLPGCRKEGSYPTTPPANDEISSITFYLQKIDSARYWGDSDKIRLQSGLIRLFPEYQTYEKKFLGTADESLDPAQAKWSKESSGKYSFSPDSIFLTLSSDPGVIRYFPGNHLNGQYTPARIEQYDSVWYSILYSSMAVSGLYIYSMNP
jgi:hypothetical protein